ncbi:unnamed protein product [Victoria cruziana]
MKRISLIPILFLALLLSFSVVSARNINVSEKETNATIDCECDEGESCCGDYCCSAQEYAAFTTVHGLPHN